jgi:hypothetical protein
MQAQLRAKGVLKGVRTQILIRLVTGTRNLATRCSHSSLIYLPKSTRQELSKYVESNMLLGWITINGCVKILKTWLASLPTDCLGNHFPESQRICSPGSTRQNYLNYVESDIFRGQDTF